MSYLLCLFCNLFLSYMKLFLMTNMILWLLIIRKWIIITLMLVSYYKKSMNIKYLINTIKIISLSRITKLMFKKKCI